MLTLALPESPNCTAARNVGVNVLCSHPTLCTFNCIGVFVQAWAMRCRLGIMQLHCGRFGGCAYVFWLFECGEFVD